MRKFAIGDHIGTSDWGPGTIIAMTAIWCIFTNDENEERAVLWEDGVWLIEKASPPETPESPYFYIEI